MMLKRLSGWCGRWWQPEAGVSRRKARSADMRFNVHGTRTGHADWKSGAGNRLHHPVDSGLDLPGGGGLVVAPGVGILMLGFPIAPGLM